MADTSTPPSRPSPQELFGSAPVPTRPSPQELFGNAPAKAADVGEEGGGLFSNVMTTGEEAARAVITAPISLVQGITELGTAGLDLALGTNTSRPTTEAFEFVKGYTGPQTKGGQVAEEIASLMLGFLPIAGWLGRASSVAKGNKVVPSSSRFLKSAETFGASDLGKAALSTRAGFIGSTAGATFAYETIVTPDGRATLSDAFDIFSPLKTEADTGLVGRDEALRRLRNKLRHGATGAGLSGAFDTLLEGLGAGAKAIGRTESGAAAASAVRSGVSAAGRGAMAIPGVQPVVSSAKRIFAPLGGADVRVSEEMFDSMALADRMEAAGVKGWNEFTSKLNKSIGTFRLYGKGKAKAEQAQGDLLRFLNGTGPRLTAYGEDVAKAADDLLVNLNNVRGSFIESVERELDNLPPGSPREPAIRASLDKLKSFQDVEQGFLRRMFRVHRDPVAYYKSLDLKGKDKKLYDEAVFEVSKNLHGKNYQTPQALEEARMVVNETLGLGAINTGLSTEAAIKEALSAARKEALEAPKSGVMSVLMPRLKLTPTLLKPREPVVDKSPKLRQLMGEIDDPKQLYLQTIADMSKTTAALNFYRNITDGPVKMVSTLADAVPALREGRRPLFVRAPDTAADMTGFDMTPFFQMAQDANVRTAVPSEATQGIPTGLGGKYMPEDFIKSFEQELVQSGYVKLGTETSDELDGIFGGQYGSLTGMYVSPEALQAVTVPMRMTSDALSDFLGVLTQLQGFSQKMAIVFNPESQVRNIVSNTLMLGSNANLGRHTDMFDVYKVFAANMADMNDEGLRRLADTIELSGTTESSLVIKALQEFREAGKDQLVSGALKKAIETAEKIIPFRQFMENTYSNSDSFFKAIGVISEQNKLMQAFAEAGELIPGRDPMLRGVPDKTLLDELRFAGIAKRVKSLAHPNLSSLEVIAADIVKSTMPIYNRVGSFVQALDSFPILGNFMSFASEVIRNSVNTLDLGLKEMSFTVSEAGRQAVGEAAAQAFERSIRAQGAQRLMAMTAVAGVIPQAAVRSSMALSGTTPEQMESIYSRLPDYTKGQDIVILRNDQEGLVEYYNLSALLPYSFVVDPAKAALRAYNRAGSIGKGEAEQIFNGVWSGLTSYAEPFLSPAMATERLIDVLPVESGIGRGGKTTTGANVYVGTDDRTNKFFSSLAHVAGVFTPGMFREVAEVRSGEFRPGRLLRAVKDMPGPQGEEYNVPAEIAMFVTGLRPMELNLRRDFQFAGNEYSPRRQQAKTQAMRLVKAPDRTPEEMINGWSYYLDNLYREQVTLYAAIQDARTLGVSDQIIRRNLIKEANIGKNEVNAIMNGRFYPGKATTEMLQEIRRVERQDRINRVTPAAEIPLRELNRMSRERTGETLVPTTTVETAPAPAPARPSPQELFQNRPSPQELFQNRAPQQQGAATPPPVFDLAPAPSAPQLPTAPANRASLSPSLLGDSPASILANMEIAQRPQG